MSDYPISGIYRHYKGPLYQVFAPAHDANVEGREVMVYMALELTKAHRGPRMAVRTVEDFVALVHPVDGSLCEHEDDCGKAQPRFLYVGQSYEPDSEDGAA